MPVLAFSRQVVSLPFIHTLIQRNISPSYPRDIPVMYMLHEEIKGRLETVLSALELEAQSIDQHISVCGQLLDLLQPREPGRIEIRWWISPRGVARGRAPYLVELRSTRRERGLGHWYQKKIPRKNAVRRVKERGDFIHTREQVRKVMEVLTELLDRREVLLRQVGGFTTSVSRLVKTNGEKASVWTSELEGMVSRFGEYAVEDERVPGAFRLDLDRLRIAGLQGEEPGAAS